MNKDTIFTLKEYDNAFQWCLENEDYTTEQIEGTKNYHFVIKEELIYNEERELESLRIRREQECFSVINRGQLWYSILTEEQLAELQTWYKAWLDVTETKVIPEKPSWIK